MSEMGAVRGGIVVAPGALRQGGDAELRFAVCGNVISMARDGVKCEPGRRMEHWSTPQPQPFSPCLAWVREV
jgi:hypothetical protein